MERIMDMTHCRGKGGVICLETDALDYFEGTEAFPIEFLGRSGSRNIGGVQPNQITGFQCNGFVLGIRIICLEVLRVFDEAFMHIVEIREFFCSGGGVR